MAESKKYRIAGDVVHRTIGSRTLILHSKTGIFYRLNESGTLLWKDLTRRVRFDYLVNILIEAYALKRAAAEKDVREFISALAKRKLVVRL
jgi:hypothetical protein